MKVSFNKAPTKRVLIFLSNCPYLVDKMQLNMYNNNRR